MKKQNQAIGFFAENHSWSEVENKIKTRAVAVLPIGAASKEHGHHLPLNTDQRQAEFYARYLCHHRNVIVWPTVGYGFYPAFKDYPGSITLQENTFISMIQDILVGIQHSGIKKCYLLNTGISTIPPLQTVGNDWRGSMSLDLLNVYSGAHYRAAREDLITQTWGSHADEGETSLMLAINQDWVDMSLAESCDKDLKGKLHPSDASQPGYSPSGVYGDATLATLKKGEILLQNLLIDLLEMLPDDIVK